ncbi:Uncharacterised protein [Mycobacteroides abscessus subsp. bolletii]|nr:Uncharacterised protein [Mycobacteroides abscessus subsp. bolletii]
MAQRLVVAGTRRPLHRRAGMHHPGYRCGGRHHPGRRARGRAAEPIRAGRRRRGRGRRSGAAAGSFAATPPLGRRGPVGYRLGRARCVVVRTHCRQPGTPDCPGWSLAGLRGSHRLAPVDRRAPGGHRSCGVGDIIRGGRHRQIERAAVRHMGRHRSDAAHHHSRRRHPGGDHRSRIRRHADRARGGRGCRYS